MEQLVILIIIGLISLVNWVMQKAAEKREEAETKRTARREVKREARRNVYTQGAPAPAPTVRRGPPERDHFKDLMDALGLPSDQLPRPPVVAEEVLHDEEFASLEESAPPPLPEPVAPRQPRWQAPPVRRPDEKTARLASAFAAVEEKPASIYRGSSLRSLLSGREAQRKAIILADILGTPKGFSAPDRW